MTDLERLQIVRKIGTGGMGEVFLAVQWEDGGFHRDVVVKRLHPHLSDDHKQVTALRDEAKLLSSVRHSGVPQVYSFRSAHSSWVIVMEHIEGASLETLRKGAADGFTVSECVLLASHLCEVLTAVQSQGIIHGDLSPANILIDSLSRPRLIDFGIATTPDMRRKNPPKGVRGSVGYIAPEVLENGKVDERTDLFSLGCVLYECVVGDRTFPTQHMQYRDVVLHSTVEPLWQVAPECPEPLADAIMKCLARDPKDRFPNAQAMLSAISKLAADTDLARGSKTLAQRLSQQPGEPTPSPEPPSCVVPLPSPSPKKSSPKNLVPNEIHQDVLAGLDEFLDEPIEDDLDVLLADISSDAPEVEDVFLLSDVPPAIPPSLPPSAIKPSVPTEDADAMLDLLSDSYDAADLDLEVSAELPEEESPNAGQTPRPGPITEDMAPGVYFVRPTKAEKPNK